MTLVEAGLEDTLANIYPIQDQEIKLDCQHLAVLINRLSEGNYGLVLLNKIEEMEHLDLHE